MDIAGLTFSAIAFVEQAIKTGTFLAKTFKDSGEAGKNVYNAVQRLEAQKYTLELWGRSWQAKARLQQPISGSIEDGYYKIWGESGHTMIVKSLGQLNLKFGEAFRTLKTIDPDSFGKAGADKGEDGSQASPSDRGSPSSGGGLRGPPQGPGQPPEGGTRRRWWQRRLSPSDPNAIWRRRRNESVSSLTSTDAPSTEEERQELEQQAVQQRLGPGTKFKWSLSRKEEIRALINDIDDWLQLLQTLAVQCEAEQKSEKKGAENEPRSIRAAAKALYAALRNLPTGHDLDFKLEKERADSGYFEQVVGHLEYLDRTDRSFKFPLLVSSQVPGAGKPMLILAEAIYSTGSGTTNSNLGQETPLGDIVRSLSRQASDSDAATSTSVLFRGPSTTIVVHSISGGSLSTPDSVEGAFLRCTFADLLHAESGAEVKPLVALWKRLQLASIIAVSVLHLYETGWISEHLETNDFHFFGSPDSQYHERTRISPYISSLEAKINGDTTPFDCLKRNVVSSDVLGSRDTRLATLFHRLGIVLFELGRGVQHHVVFQDREPTDSEVLGEIEKIQFGRQYRDLVKVCLTGSLYATSEMNIDAQFNRVVIDK